MRAGGSRPAAHRRTDDHLDPGARSVDDRSRAYGSSLAGIHVAKRKRPDSRRPRRPRLPARQQISAPRSAASRALRTSQARVVRRDGRNMRKQAKLAGMQRKARWIRRQIEGPGARQFFSAADMVVEEQPQPQHPGRPQALSVGQNETQRPDDVRGDGPQHLSLAKRFPDKAKFIIFQIAQAAMDELRRPRRRTGGEVALLAKNHRPAAACRVARDPAAVDAPANDGDVEALIQNGRRPQGLRFISDFVSVNAISKQNRNQAGQELSGNTRYYRRWQIVAQPRSGGRPAPGRPRGRENRRARR